MHGLLEAACDERDPGEWEGLVLGCLGNGDEEGWADRVGQIGLA